MEVSSKAKQEKKRLSTLQKAAHHHHLIVLTAEDPAVVLLLPSVIFLGSLEAVTPTKCSTCLEMCGLLEVEQQPWFWNRTHPLFSLLLASFLYRLLLTPFSALVSQFQLTLWNKQISTNVAVLRKKRLLGRNCESRRITASGNSAVRYPLPQFCLYKLKVFTHRRNFTPEPGTF